MSKLSIIIPSFNEPYLGRTVRDILNKAKGNIEIFVNIDGDMPKRLVKDKRVTYAHHQEPIGMRAGINLGIEKTKSKYIMKVDAHCLFAKGFDEVLKKDCKDNWLMIPRRYSLNEDGWKRGRGRIDYHFLHFPSRDRYGWRITPQSWYKTLDKEIDDVMTMQGSCWFANRRFFMNNVGYLDTERYGTFAGDQLEIGMKYWLNGGKMKVNKKTWYAHLFKNKRYYQERNTERRYKIDRRAFVGYGRATKLWFEDIKWLVEKFWPVPGWPEDRKLWHINDQTSDTHSASSQSNIQKSNLNLGLKDTPLCKLAYKYGTDKCPRIKHNFTPYYYSLFKSMRKSAKLIFEMGIGYYKDIEKTDITYDPNLKRWYRKGASLKMWRDFFPNAQIIGADIRPITQFEEERIKTYVCDESDAKQVRKLLKKFGERIDIFIDDASHKPDLQVLLAKTALPLLKKDVIYIIEDVTYPKYIGKHLEKYDCEVVKCSKRWRDDNLVIVRKK